MQKILEFCGKKNCCPQFVKSEFGVSLVDEHGSQVDLSTDEFLSMIAKIRSMKDSDLLDFIS